MREAGGAEEPEVAGGRAARRALGLVVLLHVVFGLHGIDQPVRRGHEGWHVAEHGLGARNLVRWGSLTFTTWYGPEGPPDQAKGFHHPTMLQVPVAAAQAVLGDGKPWVVRLVGLAASTAALLAFWAFALRARGPTTALVAALLFAVDPLVLAFSHLPDTQMPGIAWAFAAAALALGLREDPSRRRILLVLGAVGAAALCDWPFYPMAFLAGAAAAYSLRKEGPLARDLSPADLRRLRLALAAGAALVLLVFGQHLVRAWLAGNLDDLFGAATRRGQGQDPISFLSNAALALSPRHTPLLLGLGATWLLVLVLRRRCDAASILVASALAGQLAYMTRFQNEFWVHEYRSLWLAAPLAFAGADLAARAGARLPARLSVLPGLALAATVAVLAVPVFEESRENSGCLDDDPYDPRPADQVAARVVSAALPRDGTVALGPGFKVRLEPIWLLDRPAVEAKTPEALRALAAAGGPVAFVADAGKVLEPSWTEVLVRGRVLLAGDLAVVLLVPEAQPSVEHAVLRPPEPCGALVRWLRAPTCGPDRLGSGDAGLAARYAKDLGHATEVLRDARAGGTPILDALPADLVDREALPPERLVHLRQVGGTGGRTVEARCPPGVPVSALEVTESVEKRVPVALELRCRRGAREDAFPVGRARFGLPSELRCPAGRVAAGIHGRSARRVESIGLLCEDPAAPAAKSDRKRRGAGSTAASAPERPVTEEPAVGRGSGRAYRLLCPPEHELRSLRIRAGGRVDAISIGCGRR